MSCDCGDVHLRGVVDAKPLEQSMKWCCHDGSMLSVRECCLESSMGLIKIGIERCNELELLDFHFSFFVIRMHTQVAQRLFCSLSYEQYSIVIMSRGMFSSQYRQLISTELKIRLGKQRRPLLFISILNMHSSPCVSNPALLRPLTPNGQSNNAKPISNKIYHRLQERAKQSREPQVRSSR